MSRHQDSFEKQELERHPLFERFFAFILGKQGFAALTAGEYKTGIWHIAETFKGHNLGISRQEAVERLVAIVDEAAKTKDGTKLRLLAYAVEAICPLTEGCGVHDPLRAVLLMLVSRGETCESKVPLELRLASLNRLLAAARPGSQPLTMQQLWALEKQAWTPATAAEVQNLIRGDYPSGAVPTLKTIREVAREMGVPLAKAKAGSPKGKPHKAVHRVCR